LRACPGKLKERISLKPFEDVLNRYTDHLKIRNYSPSTIENYRKSLKEFLTYLSEEEGLTRIQDVTKEVLRSWEAKVYARIRVRGNGPLSLGTKHHKITALKSLFSFLLKKQEILYNPASSLELPTLRRDKLRDSLKEREIKKLIEAPSGHTLLGIRDRAIMELFYSTGIRNSELRAIEIQDVDFERQEIRILHAKGYFGERQRLVPVGKKALLYLEEYLKCSRPKLLKEPSLGVLFVTKSGRALRVEDPRDIVFKYEKLSGLKKHAYPHLFRHSFAAHLLRHGADIRYVQEMLGHKSLNSTQSYTKIEISDLKRIHHKTHPREQS